MKEKKYLDFNKKVQVFFKILLIIKFILGKVLILSLDGTIIKTNLMAIDIAILIFKVHGTNMGNLILHLK